MRGQGISREDCLVVDLWPIMYRSNKLLSIIPSRKIKDPSAPHSYKYINHY